MTSHDLALPGLVLIRQKFLVRLAENQKDLEACVAIIDGGSDDASVRQNIQSAVAILHKVSGSAGSLGFAELGVLAHNCERTIRATLDQDAPLGDADRNSVVTLLDDFIDACDQIEE